MKKTLLTVVAIFIVFVSFGQNDPVLFTVNGKPVNVSEFNYIYSKTNGTKADFSKKSVEEYLDLYTKFKMKVARARDMRLDTIPTLQEELAGYRRQLAESYLTDREVTDRLVKELHDRMTKDVSISHILFRVEKNDTTAALTKAKVLKARLDKGDKFENIAREASDDPSSKEKGGLLGFLTAMLPDGFYPFESACYNTPAGQISDIVRSPLGYHIIKVNVVRPARGEIEASHIMVRKTKEGFPQTGVKERIDSIYAVLQKSGNFEELARKHSDDAGSAEKGGYLGFFGIGRFEIVFENAAFEIPTDQTYGKPFESSIGWHIIKRISRKEIEKYDVMKSRLKARVQRDGRFELAKKAMTERIKRDAKFTEERPVFVEYVGALDSTILSYSWNPPAKVADKKLFSLNNKAVSTAEFSQYLLENPNPRMSYAIDYSNNVGAITKKMYDDFVNQKALAFEEAQLETKYTDFKNLMREYEEGILLFEAIKLNVWDKASQDSVGLDKFFDKNKTKYVWDERAQVIFYNVLDSAKNDLETIRIFAQRNTPQEVLKKFNTKNEIVAFKEETIEKGKNPDVESLGWRAGIVGVANQNGRDRSWTFMKVEKILPKGQKELKEARGFVVSDYQEFLEKEWINELTKQYKVEVNKNVLNSIVK